MSYSSALNKAKSSIALAKQSPKQAEPPSGYSTWNPIKKMQSIQKKKQTQSKSPSESRQIAKKQPKRSLPTLLPSTQPTQPAPAQKKTSSPSAALKPKKSKPQVYQKPSQTKTKRYKSSHDQQSGKEKGYSKTSSKKRISLCHSIEQVEGEEGSQMADDHKIEPIQPIEKIVEVEQEKELEKEKALQDGHSTSEEKPATKRKSLQLSQALSVLLANESDNKVQQSSVSQAPNPLQQVSQSSSSQSVPKNFKRLLKSSRICDIQYLPQPHSDEPTTNLLPKLELQNADQSAIANMSVNEEDEHLRELKRIMSGGFKLEEEAERGMRREGLELQLQDRPIDEKVDQQDVEIQRVDDNKEETQKQTSEKEEQKEVQSDADQNKHQNANNVEDKINEIKDQKIDQNQSIEIDQIKQEQMPNQNNEDSLKVVDRKQIINQQKDKNTEQKDKFDTQFKTKVEADYPKENFQDLPPRVQIQSIKEIVQQKDSNTNQNQVQNQVQKIEPPPIIKINQNEPPPQKSKTVKLKTIFKFQSQTIMIQMDIPREDLSPKQTKQQIKIEKFEQSPKKSEQPNDKNIKPSISNSPKVKQPQKSDILRQEPNQVQKKKKQPEDLKVTSQLISKLLKKFDKLQSLKPKSHKLQPVETKQIKPTSNQPLQIKLKPVPVETQNNSSKTSRAPVTIPPISLPSHPVPDISDLSEIRGDGEPFFEPLNESLDGSRVQVRFKMPKMEEGVIGKSKLSEEDEIKKRRNLFLDKAVEKKKLKVQERKKSPEEDESQHPPVVKKVTIAPATLQDHSRITTITDYFSPNPAPKALKRQTMSPSLRQRLENSLDSLRRPYRHDVSLMRNDVSISRSLEDLDDYMQDFLKGSRKKGGLADLPLVKRDIAMEKRKRHCEQINWNFLRGRIGQGLKVKTTGIKCAIPLQNLFGLSPPTSSHIKHQHNHQKLHDLLSSLQLLHSRCDCTALQNSINQHMKVLELDRKEYQDKVTELRLSQRRFTDQFSKSLGLQDQDNLGRMLKAHGIVWRKKEAKQEKHTAEEDQMQVNKALIATIVKQIGQTKKTKPKDNISMEGQYLEVRFL